MTSYATSAAANETTSNANTAAPAENDATPPASATTPTTTTTTSPPPLLTPPTSPPDCNSLTSKMAASAATLLPRNVSQNNCDDFDCDSLSDGHEKADTTPENIKKIDDVIEQQQQQQQQQQRRSLHYHTTADSATSPLGVGLAVAIDDSNAKYCFVNPLRSPKDTLSKSELRIESSSDSSPSVTPSTMPVSSSNNNNYNYNRSNSNNHADNNEIKADIDASEAHDDDSSASNTTTTATKQSYAFTIDNFNEKDCDPAATAAKYKNMLERFQTRHRRGASMSKLEGDGTKDTLTSSASAAPLTQRNSRNSCELTAESDTLADPVTKVKLRVRDRSTSRVRDAAKRHSWSPRSSSTQESLQQSGKQAAASGQHKSTLPPTSARKSSGASKAKQPPPPPLQMPKGAANLIANRTQFTPRSTAMQMALQKVDFLTAPLGDYKHLSAEDEDDVSEAGTYTLDGDNYTEEQKDLMNIDKNARLRARMRRPKNLDLVGANESTTKIPVHVNNRNSSNVLEVNYYHDAAEVPQPQSPRYKPNANDLILGSHQSAGAYLEKIKSRVLRNMSATKNDDITCVAPAPPKYGESSKPSANEDDDDLGCFTSVTTSGVLAKQGALDPRPKLTRKSSLSTSQIDSSEYVSNESKLKNPQASAYAAGGFTDHQKAEYRLNLFTNQKDAQKFAATRSFIESPPDTPTAKLSDTAVLKTAATKNDWIQEWARNARARSLANENYHHQRTAPKDHDPCGGELMTRSYTGGGCADSSLTDDSIYSKQCAAASAKLNKTLAERYRLAGECDFSSDPILHASSVKAQPDTICKPPKSPSKIPSPLHSLGRARSASRTRAPLQNMLPPNDDDTEDDYLQRTAAAINSLQQSLSRKNSLKSPTPHSASPRAHSARSHPPLYSPSPEDCTSPQHSLGSPTAAAALAATYRSPLQRRNLSNAAQLQLMTSSFNEQQLALLTSGEYLMKQMRMRKNSFDGNIAGGNSPARRAAAVAAAAAQASRVASGDQELSPLRRSSSFSAKIAASTQRAARPNFANIYTPPAARHNYSVAAPQLSAAASNAQALKKSASSNNFSQVYSDYDENLQYYINDEDDMEGGTNEYYSSGAEEDDEMTGGYYKGEGQHVDTAAVPLSNTRYNKALLMRIERSKQKVTGKVSSAPPLKSTTSATASAGVVACPNTPELPRRGIKSAPRSGAARQSMPRDASLSRLANQVPNSLASAKKQLLQTAAAVPTNTTATRSSSNQRVQPKYMDISKYKPVQGNNFLRKNDAKSTLKAPSTSATTIDAMKRSPSSSSMGLTRADPSRVSNRSMRSVGSCMTTSATSLGGSGRASSAVRRDASIAKQKEAEMAMWKRRSTYDPMKAAAEDRRKKEEAKRLALAKLTGDVPCESTTLARAQSSYNHSLSLEEQWTEYDDDDDDEHDEEHDQAQQNEAECI